MRAVLCKAWGGTETLEVGDMAAPDMIEGGVRIAVHAAAVNFADILMVQGKYQEKPAFPFAPGLECAGEVLEVAPGVEGLAPGDRVFAVTGHGGFAEEVVSEAKRVFKIPDSMPYEHAAAFPVAYGTSHIGLIEKAGLSAGETVLVNGAAGGVGLTAVEIAKHVGATVIATAGGAEKLQVAAAAGADHLIDYKTEDIREKVKEMTGGKGVNVVYDPVGGDAFDGAFRSTARGGRLVLVGFASGTVPQLPANILLVKNITAIGYYWGAHFDLDPALMRRSFDELLGWYADGALKPHISHHFPLEQAAEAMDTLAARRSTGKVVITIR